MTAPTLTAELLAVASASERRLAVRVTPDALRHVRAHHPWVFEESITSISHDRAVAGDLAVIFDARREFAAIGLYDPASPIRVKVLHAGRPRMIDDEWWNDMLRQALDRRRVFVEAPDAEYSGYRVVNGENDGLPGLVVDRYATTLVVKLYSAVWFAHLATITRALLALTGCGGVVLRLARTVATGTTFGLHDGDVIAGSVDDGPVRFAENGLWFDADVRRGQKTGHFLDQRANRIRVGDRAEGRRVLDVFASTGGFSVHAAAGGAHSVHAVDLSAPTLAAAEHNMALNTDLATVRTCRFTTEVGDAFEVMADLARSGAVYDIAVVDPPSFAQRQDNVARAVRAYGRLTRMALRLIVPGGLLVQASCSSRVPADLFFDTVVGAARDAGRPLTELDRTAHDTDHPVGFAQGAYLKAGFWTAP